MFELIQKENEMLNPNLTPNLNYEVSRFMENFFDAVHRGDIEEANTYFSHTADPIEMPIHAEAANEVIVVDDYFASYTCNLKGTRMHFSFSLDKSKGYWEIIQGEIQGSNTRH